MSNTLNTTKYSDKNKYYVYENGIWMHRSPIKLAINPILRKIQFFTDKPFVIASETIFVDKIPQFVGYKFCRIFYMR